MNDDNINRQTAIDAICKACSIEKDYHKCDSYPKTSTWCNYLVTLRALPSAERRGRWNRKEDPYGIFDTIIICSECGSTARYRETSTYCPYCGAKMENER